MLSFTSLLGNAEAPALPPEFGKGTTLSARTVGPTLCCWELKMGSHFGRQLESVFKVEQIP